MYTVCDTGLICLSYGHFRTASMVMRKLVNLGLINLWMIFCFFSSYALASLAEQNIESDGKGLTNVPAVGILPMTFPEKQWEPKRSDLLGISQESLETAISWLTPLVEDEGGMGRVMIIRNGYVIWQGDDVDAISPTNCSCKAFTSSVVGSLFGETNSSLKMMGADYAPFLKKDYGDLNMLHFITKTTGYNAVGSTYGNSLDGSNTIDQPAPVLFKPGEKFHYHDDSVRVFGYILTRMIEEHTPYDNLHDYFQNKIGDRISMQRSRYYWDNIDHNGSVVREYPSSDTRDAVNGMQIAVTEFARLAHLWLNNGKWNGEQIIDSAYIRKAISPQVPDTRKWLNTDDFDGPWGKATNTSRDKKLSKPGPGRYGYLWWTNGKDVEGNKLHPDCPDNMYWAQGGGSKRVYVLPDEGMIVIRLGTHRRGDGSDHLVWNHFIKLLLAGIEPLTKR